MKTLYAIRPLRFAAVVLGGASLILFSSFYGVAGSEASVSQSVQAEPQAHGSHLEAVLDQMDRAAAIFRSAEANLQWDQYQKVIDATETQTGTIYFKKQKNEMEMAADFVQPEKKYLVFSEGKLRFYQPKIDQVTEYNAGKNKEEIESFLALGFGSRGHELLGAYEITDLGAEVVDGVDTEKLQLVPKSPRVKNMFERFVLWVNPEQSISLKQQAFEPSGDYRLAHYTSVRYNQKIPDDVFKLRTTAHTKIAHPE